MPGRRPSKSVRFSRHPSGSIGCTIGLAPHVFVGAYGADAADALSQAGQLAAQMQNLADQHPEVKAAVGLIPGGAAALMAISTAARLYNTPGVSAKEVIATVGPKVASVVKSILSIF